MNSIDLSEKHNVNKSTISKKTAKALEEGVPIIEVGGVKYRVSKHGGRYDYEPYVSKKPEARQRDPAEIRYLALPVEKRREAEKRLDLVRLYERRGDKSYSQFVASLPRRLRSLKFSKRQFERWLKAVRECPSNQTPLVYLADKRGVTTKDRAIHDEMAAAIERMIMEKPHRKAKRIYEYLCRQFDDVPSYETIRRWITKWKETHYLEYAFAKNPDKAKGQYKPAGGSMSEAVRYPNALWELDATPADVICSDGKRYTLSAAIDVYSRRVAIVIEESANYSTLAKLMRKAIKKFGVPEEVKVDNGKDYTSNYFDATCSRLRINKIEVAPYSGELKPHIERFFGTLTRELFEELPGYIGHNVADREALQSRQSFQKKLESIERWRQKYKDGNTFAKRFALKKENAGLEVGIPLSRDELQQWVDKWIVMYENRVHGGIKTTPMKQWQRNLHEVRRIEDERMLDILLGISTTRTIRKKGIDWHGITYWSEMFGDMVGQKVWVLSDDDLSSIYIYDLEMNYLFTAYSPEHVNMSRSSYLAATKKYTKRVRKIIKALEILESEAPERMMERINSEIGLDTQDGIKQSEPLPSLETVQERVAAAADANVVEADVRINGRPTFTKFYDRFLWDIEHDMVDEKTKQLAEKYPDSWEMAQKEAQRRQAG